MDGCQGLPPCFFKKKENILFLAREGIFFYLKRFWRKHIALFLCSLGVFTSCGKKPTQKKKTENIKKSQFFKTFDYLHFQLKEDGEKLFGEKLLNKRFLFHFPEYIKTPKGSLKALELYFHVQDKSYEFSCLYRAKTYEDDQVSFQGCEDNQGQKISYLQPNILHHLPQGESLYIEAIGEESTFTLPLLDR